MSPQITLTVQNRKKRSAEEIVGLAASATNQSKNWRTHVQRKTASLLWQIVVHPLYSCMQIKAAFTEVGDVFNAEGDALAKEELQQKLGR